MKFRAIHTNQENYYAVGFDDDTQQLVLEVVITWIAWYNRYFALTREEFDWFTSDRQRLDDLAAACAGVNGIANHRERFLHSQKIEENAL